MVKENSLRALSMVEEVRKATREIEPKVKASDLGALAKEALDEAKIPRRVKPIVTIEGGASKVRIDPDLMRRILDNLISNAVEAMPDGGSLRLDVKMGEETVIEVTDTGVGIPAEKQSHIWEPFFTTKSKGFGLGLAFCKRAVEAQGGSITYESKVGEGTTFTIRLPANST